MKKLKRCQWVDLNKQDYVQYHDDEWGKPVYDDQTFFEFLVLESAQAGLNWYTILKRREHYRIAFEEFNVQKVANYGDNKIHELLNNESIIRNRRKIESAVNNAKCFIQIQNEFGSFAHYIWGFTNHKIIYLDAHKTPPVTTKLSDTITQDMKNRGFQFIGSTIIYSLLQACGLVNDHENDCYLFHKNIKNKHTKNI